MHAPGDQIRSATKMTVCKTDQKPLPLPLDDCRQTLGAVRSQKGTHNSLTMPDALRGRIYLHDRSLRKEFSSAGRMMGQTGTHSYNQIALSKGLARGRVRKTSGDPERTWIALEKPTHRERGRQQAVASFGRLFAKGFGTGRLSAASRDNDDAFGLRNALDRPIHVIRMRHHGPGIPNLTGRGHVFDVGRDLDLLQIDRNTEHDWSMLGLCNLERFRQVFEHASEAASSDDFAAILATSSCDESSPNTLPCQSIVPYCARTADCL